MALVVNGLMMWTGEGKNSQCSEGVGKQNLGVGPGLLLAGSTRIVVQMTMAQ